MTEVRKVRLVNDDREWNMEYIAPFTFNQASDSDNWRNIEHRHLWRQKTEPLPELKLGDYVKIKTPGDTSHWETVAELSFNGIKFWKNFGLEFINSDWIISIWRDGKIFWEKD